MKSRNDIERMRQHIIDRIDMSKEPDDEELHQIIDNVMVQESDYKFISLNERWKIHRQLFDSIRGLGILEELIHDKEISEIMVNGVDNIYVEKKGHIEKVSGMFASKERLEEVIQQIVANTNRRVNQSTPIVDTRLKDGSRVNVVLPPIALDGATITIRKFPERHITMDDLIEWNSITDEAAAFLQKLVMAGYNIFISGGTGSGKTTFLNALSNFIPEDERVITIEDSAELQLLNTDNLVRMETRQANTEGENEITIKDLIKTSLRMRPDRIIVGEVRGAEALDMLQAMNTGHDGSMSTGHSNSALDMISRLETMVLSGVEMPIQSIRGQISAAIDIMVHLGRIRDKTRKVLEINELRVNEKQEIMIVPLFKFKEEGECEGKVIGKLMRTDNTLKGVEKLKNHGMNME